MERFYLLLSDILHTSEAVVMSEFEEIRLSTSFKNKQDVRLDPQDFIEFFKEYYGPAAAEQLERLPPVIVFCFYKWISFWNDHLPISFSCESWNWRRVTPDMEIQESGAWNQLTSIFYYALLDRIDCTTREDFMPTKSFVQKVLDGYCLIYA